MESLTMSKWGHGLGRGESSLLLYLESCAVDLGGRLDPRRLNDDDRTILEEWKKESFVEHGRIRSEDCNDQGCEWVRLSPEAHIIAAKERLQRAGRMWKNRRYLTTFEERERGA